VKGCTANVDELIRPENKTAFEDKMYSEEQRVPRGRKKE
jgi:hypothetical protein